MSPNKTRDAVAGCSAKSATIATPKNIVAVCYRPNDGRTTETIVLDAAKGSKCSN